MAYVRRSPEEEEALQQQTVTGAPAAPASGGGGGGSAPGAAPTQAAGPAKGSGYVGLDAYANANRAGGAAMADALTGRAEGQASFARDRVDLARNAFAAGAREGAGAGGYAGPESLETFADGAFASTGESAQKGYAAVSRLSSWEGRQTALQDVYGQGGGYSQGAQRLDTALAGGANAGRYDALKQKYADLPRAWGEARKEADATVKAARETSAALAAQKAAVTQAARARYAEEAERREELLRRRAGAGARPIVRGPLDGSGE